METLILWLPDAKSQFIERTDAEAEALILCPPDVKSRHIKKTLIMGKIEGRRKRG